MKSFKNIITCVVALILVFGLLLLIFKNEATPVSYEANMPKKVIIDAGHGGFDGGAVATDGTSEKDINLSIALTIGDMLSSCGYDVVYTRVIDTGTEDNTNDSISKRKVSDLNNRLKLMEENPDAIFVSVHLNKFTATSVNGAQVFYSPNNVKSRDLGAIIQKSIVTLLQKENKRVAKQSPSSTFLLKKTTLPAVIVECGFLSNTKELQLLKDDEYQKQMAFAVFCGIEEFLMNEV